MSLLGPPEALAGLRQSLGLNDPILVQYAHWVGGLLSGDWGNSLIFKNIQIILLRLGDNRPFFEECF